MQNQFVKRLKSLLWRTSMVMAAAGVEFLLANLGVLDLPQWAVVLSGLGLGELSKYINTQKAN